jgi:hypothetical protein
MIWKHILKLISLNRGKLFAPNSKQICRCKQKETIKVISYFIYFQNYHQYYFERDRDLKLKKLEFEIVEKIKMTKIFCSGLLMVIGSLIGKNQIKGFF